MVLMSALWQRLHVVDPSLNLNEHGMKFQLAHLQQK